MPADARPAATDRVIKPKTARAKRALLARAPRQVETLKKALLLHSGKTSGVLKSLLADLSALKADEALKLSRKNAGVRPFEGGGEASLEFLARKADCSLFALASHSKKRPHNLVLGRMFDFRLLDMVEFGVRARRVAGRPARPQPPAAAAAATLGRRCFGLLRLTRRAADRWRTTKPSASLAPWRRRARAAPSRASSFPATPSRLTRCAPPRHVHARRPNAPARAAPRRRCAPPRACSSIFSAAAWCRTSTCVAWTAPSSAPPSASASSSASAPSGTRSQAPRCVRRCAAVRQTGG